MRTLPPALLRHSAILQVPRGVDGWQNVTGAQSITLSRVFTQVSEGVRMSMQNAEVQLRAELWYDCRLSAPKGLDLLSLFRRAMTAGAKLQCVIGGATYAVESVELLSDGRGRSHHYHLEMS